MCGLDRISLETSCLLKFEIWLVSVCINCNYSRHLGQVSFFNFLTWYEVCYPSLDIPLRISMNIPLAEEVDFCFLTSLTRPHELLSIRVNWKIVGRDFFEKLEIDGSLLVKSKVPRRSGSVALRQLTPIHKKGL